MSYKDMTEGSLGELIAEVASNEDSGPRYIQKAWVIGAVRALRDARQRAGRTQADLARVLGTTQSAIARLENNRDGRLNLRRFAEYAVACGYGPLDVVLQPLEDVMAFAAANPGRPRSPLAFQNWIGRNNLLSANEPYAERAALVTSSDFIGFATAVPAAPGRTGKNSNVSTPLFEQRARPAVGALGQPTG
jgi:transcriptional regulator with XRE-family HTH domain